MLRTRTTLGNALILLALVATPALAGAGTITARAAPPWVNGDVFVSISSGKYQIYDHGGHLKETIDDGLGGFTTGCAFDPAMDKLYTTNWSHDKVPVYDATTHNLVRIISTTSSLNESVVFTAAGDFYVSHAGGGGIDHFDAAGDLIGTLGSMRTDWMDLAADQRTMFYTDEGAVIHRFDVVANSPLPDFAPLATGEGFELRLLPAVLGGGLLVSAGHNVTRLDSSGSVVQTYNNPTSPEGSFFSLALDTNGTAFWAGVSGNANFYRFDIASGAIQLGPLNTGTGVQSLLGLCTKGEPTAATSADLSLTKSASPDPVLVGGTLTYTLTASNAGPATATSVTVTDPLPAGVSFVSAATSQGSCGQSAGTVTCSLGSLAPAGSATITIKGIPTAKGSLTNTATVTAFQPDPNPANNVATVTSRALSVTGSAFGEQVRSLLINSGPTPFVSQTGPGSRSATLASISVATLLTANTLAVSTQVGPDVSVTSTATVNSLSMAAGAISATNVQSTCSATATSVSGSTTIASLTIAGVTTTNLTPAPNTTINVAGVGVLTLNEQTTSPAGSITVNAIHLNVAGSGADIIVAQSRCVVDP